MYESIPTPQLQFQMPQLARESGEFERVGKQFGIDSSVLLFQAQLGTLVELDEDTWNQLENTDSYDLSPGDWEAVDQLATMAARDWRSIRNTTILDAPIIMRYRDRYHLVAGNTRLLVARALGNIPRVLLFSVDAGE